MFRLTRIQEETLRAFAKANSILLVVLYGSFAKGEENANSDADVAILRKGIEDIQDYYQDYDRLVSGLGKVFIDRRIDLTPLRGRDPLFFYQIMKNGVLLYGDSRLFNQMKVNAIMRYIDAKPLFKAEKILVYKRQKYLMQRPISIIKSI